jgi:hypothetical protein
MKVRTPLSTLAIGLVALMLGGCTSTRVGTTTPRSAWMDSTEEQRILLQAQAAAEAPAAEPETTSAPPVTQDDAPRADATH